MRPEVSNPVMDQMGLESAIRQQDGDSIDDGIASATTFAQYGCSFKLQGLTADWADDPTHVCSRQCVCAHASILTLSESHLTNLKESSWAADRSASAIPWRR